MVAKVDVNKGNYLGYSIRNGEFVGRTLGYDVYVEYDGQHKSRGMIVSVYD